MRLNYIRNSSSCYFLHHSMFSILIADLVNLDKQPSAQYNDKADAQECIDPYYIENGKKNK